MWCCEDGFDFALFLVLNFVKLQVALFAIVKF